MRVNTLAKGIFSTLIIISAVVAGAFGQEKVRSIEQPAKFTYKKTPIEVAFMLDGDQMKDRKAIGRPDWLRRISLDVKNISDKEINLIIINLMLKEPVYGAKVASVETAGIVITYDLRYTNVKTVAPGASVTLKARVEMVDLWTDAAQKQGLVDIDRVILDIRSVGFTDDTSWYRGIMSRKDPVTGESVFIDPSNFLP